MHALGIILIALFGCDDLRTPQACCAERAARHEEQCAASGQVALGCASQSGIVLSSCLDMPGDTMLAGSSTCVAFCQQIGDALYAGCRGEGGSGYECGQLAQSFMATCFIEDCGLEPPGPTCDEVCQNISISAFGQCMITGGDYQGCGQVADTSYLGCLTDNCHIDDPEMACDFICFRLAQDFYYACDAISGNAEACTESAETVRQICVNQTCTVGDDCTGECPFIVADDGIGDAVPRQTNSSEQASFDPARPLVDLISSTLGKWQPVDAHKSLFDGEYRFDGRFFKLELLLAGLVNPPGPVLFQDAYWPEQYGPNPVYGFVEIDVDANVATGGEIDDPELRYLGNAVRFGGRVPSQSFHNRLAVDGAAFDDDLTTPPFVERHGEDFHLSLLGLGKNDTITQLVGDIDYKFEEGETWILHGPFLHRAHGYDELDLVAEEYEPDSYLMFQHDVDQDVTSVTLVFPLTNFAAGLMRDETPEQHDFKDFNHASIAEGVEALRLWANYWATEDDSPQEHLILDWQHAPDLLQLLDPTNWTYTVLLGTYNESFESEGVAVWTDIHPDVVPGDIVGTGIRTGYDGELILEFIQAHDLADGVADNRVVLAGFATNFSLYDVNHDGVVDSEDVIFTNGDANQDGAVDLTDFAILQRCAGKEARFPPCASLDLNGDQVVDLEDFPQFFQRFEGPIR